MRRRELSELMRLNRVACERNTQAFERVMAALDRNEERLELHEQLFEDHKTFIREMNRRNEKVVQDLFHRNEEFNAEQALRIDAVVNHLVELIDESKAHSQAVFALIDRLPPPRAA